MAMELWFWTQSSMRILFVTSRNLVLCAFLEGVDVGDWRVFLETRLDENSVPGIRVFAFCVIVCENVFV